MGLVEKIKRVFGGKSTAVVGRKGPSRGEMSELAEKLDEMRGDNVSVTEGAGNFAPNRDGIENLSNAARDGRIINRTNEDETISDLSSYRTADEK